MSSNIRLDTPMDYEDRGFQQEQQQQQDERRQQLLAQRAQVDAELAALQPSYSQSSHHHRSPIHKQNQQRRSSHVPRSMSSTGSTGMARHHSSDLNEMSQRHRALSQRSVSGMIRMRSRGQRPNVPFTQNGTLPPILNSGGDNLAIMDWATTRDEPLTPYTFSHQTPQLQLSKSQQNSLEQVPELQSVGENPGDYIMRTFRTEVSPTISIPSWATINSHRLSSSSYNHLQTPSTPTTGSLTNTTTLASDMSRQSSLVNNFESMMPFNSNSVSNDSYNDLSLYGHVTPSSASCHSRRSSDDEQAQLLAGTGGASLESQFSNSFQFPSSNSLGEKMEKSQSAESTSSTSSSSSSRSVKRLQEIAGQTRPLMPKGGSLGIPMSRDNSSHAMTRIESKDGSQDKVAISNRSSYQRPKHERVYCKQCDNHPDGFRGEHEHRRHVDREHNPTVKKWMCVEPTDGNHPQPIVPLSRCKACSQQKKKYGAYYNAAAHLRRAHFNPKTKGRSKSQQKTQDADKRGGTGGGDDPPMTELKKYWIKEVEEQADFITNAQDAAEESEDEGLDNGIDEQTYSEQTMSTISNSTKTYNPSYLADYQPTIADFPNNTPIDNEFLDMQDMLSLDYSDSKQQVYMNQTMYPLSNQTNLPLFSTNLYPNDQMAFTNPIPSQVFENFEWNM